MYARATAMALSDGSGSMMALGCTAVYARDLISDIPDLYMAAMNSPDAVTVAGSFEAITKLEEKVS